MWGFSYIHNVVNHYHNPIPEHFHYPTSKKPSPVSDHFLLPSLDFHALASTNLPSVSMDSLIVDI